jgi:hypothetical protein
MQIGMLRFVRFFAGTMDFLKMLAKGAPSDDCAFRSKVCSHGEHRFAPPEVVRYGGRIVLIMGV